VSIDSSLRDALSLMLTEGTGELQVVNGEGKPVGRVRMETITGFVGPEGHPREGKVAQL
jgi:predicted transcriptional regulator